MQLTIADGVVALVVLVSALLAYHRGATREVLAIGGWLLAGLVAFYFASMAAPLVLEVPYLGDFLKSSCTLTAVAAFASVFAIALIILSIFTPLISAGVQGTLLAPIDKGFGFVFGIARGVLLVAVLYLLYDTIITENERIAAIDNSASHGFIEEAAATLRDNAPTSVPDWLQNRIDALLGDCGPTEPDSQALSLPLGSHLG